MNQYMNESNESNENLHVDKKNLDPYTSHHI